VLDDAHAARAAREPQERHVPSHRECVLVGTRRVKVGGSATRKTIDLSSSVCYNTGMLRRLTAWCVLIAFVVFTAEAGQWRCGDRLCGSWFWRECCGPPEAHANDHAHTSADDHHHSTPDVTTVGSYHQPCGYVAAPEFARSVASSPPVIATDCAIVPITPGQTVIAWSEVSVPAWSARGPPERRSPHTHSLLRAPPIA
jgi:hypothetical protein